MNAAHLHLMVNHLPLFAAAFAGMLLTIGLLRKDRGFTNSGLVLAVVAGVGAFGAVLTGQAAEEVVESYALVSEAAIEGHEEAAEAALLATVALGALALAALGIPARMARHKRAAGYGALALSLVAFALVARTANLGGAIRHPEVVDASPVMMDRDADALEREH